MFIVVPGPPVSSQLSNPELAISANFDVCGRQCSWFYISLYYTLLHFTLSHFVVLHCISLHSRVATKNCELNAAAVKPINAYANAVIARCVKLSHAWLPRNTLAKLYTFAKIAPQYICENCRTIIFPRSFTRYFRGSNLTKRTLSARNVISRHK